MVLALAGLFGMFTASATNTLRFNHIPGRVYARAGGTARAMSQREQVEKAAAQTADEERTPPADLDIVPALPAPAIASRIRQAAEQPRPASTALWPPLHLFRPPPVLSVA